MAQEDLSKLAIDKSKVRFRGGRGRKIVYLVLGVLGLAGAGLLYHRGVFTPAVEVQLASVTQIYPSQAFTKISASGYVVPQRKSALASKVTGRLVWLGVEEGSRVKKDQVIARLESEDVKAAQEQARANLAASRFNLEQAKAELADADLSLKRSRELVEKDYIARADYDSALARQRKALAGVRAAREVTRANEAALEGADIQLEYTLIRAPFDAVVLTKNADVGDIVTPIGAAANAKSAVVTIADMDSLQVEADVSESNLTQVRRGQPCEIQLDALPDRRFRGAVHMIVPTGDRSKASVLVKVRFLEKNPHILPEMSAKVAFLSRNLTRKEEKPRTALNRGALVVRDDGHAVFLLRGNRAVETPVRIGPPIGDMVEVLEGVIAGDQVILRPPPGLRTGSKIKAKEL
jgi:RND family efflux transporter MFP subunit